MSKNKNRNTPLTLERRNPETGKMERHKVGGLTREQLDAVEAAQRAAQGQTPAIVLAAFPPPVNAVGNFVLLPVTGTHWMSLERLESPFVRDDKADAVPGAEDIFAALYVLTTPGPTLWNDSQIADARLRLATINGKIAAIANAFPAVTGWCERVSATIRGHLAQTLMTVIHGGSQKSGSLAAEMPPGAGDPLAVSQPPDQAAAGSSPS
ncbi:MAG: hypothetical protein NT105_23695 [Verrucomicrobia bacterium]|nr:hypothetical protein [Verrucomicrobiota bacterium]